MNFPAGTRYLYFGLGLALVFAGVAGVSQTPRGQEILRDVREEFGLAVAAPDVPTPPKMASGPLMEANKVEFIPVTKPALDKRVALLQNEVMRQSDEFILVRGESSDRFILRNSEETKWSVLSQYPSTVSPNLSSTPVEMIDLDTETGFDGEFFYQEPHTGRTFRLSTDDRQVHPLARVVEYNGSEITYAFVLKEQVIESRNLGLVKQYQLTTPTATLRRINLETQTYSDQTIELPVEVTTRLSDIYISAESVYVNGIYLKGKDFEMPTYNGYRAEGEVIYKDGVEVARIPLREELNGLEVLDFRDGLLYLKSVLPGEYNPGSNLLTYNLETGELEVVLENTYRLERSDYVFYDFGYYRRSSVPTLPVSEEELLKQVQVDEAVLPDSAPENTLPGVGPTPEEWRRANEYTRNVSYALPGSFAGSITQYNVAPGSALSYSGHQLMINHSLVGSNLRILPRRSALLNSELDQTLRSLPEFFRTGDLEAVEGRESFPGPIRLFYAFHPYAYEGPAYYHNFGERVAAPGYTAAWVLPYSGCYGRCTYGYVLFLEHETGYSLFTTANASHGFAYGQDPLQACEEGSCVQKEFQTQSELVAAREALLNTARELKILQE